MTCPPEHDLSAGAASAPKVEGRRRKAALVISDRDNVATALEPLDPGALLDVAGRRVTVSERIPSGHKVALRRIASGEGVMKYGSAIGTALADIPEGAHVHTHNVVSTRGRGDLARPTNATEARLAEPDDQASPVAQSFSSGNRCTNELSRGSDRRTQESADE